jgi:hypothetical protein
VHEAIGRSGYLGAGIRPAWPGSRVGGTAVTALCWPGDNLMIHAAVEQCRPGDMLVVTTTSPSADGAFGELLRIELYKPVRVRILNTRVIEYRRVLPLCRVSQNGVDKRLRSLVYFQILTKFNALVCRRRFGNLVQEKHLIYPKAQYVAHLRLYLAFFAYQIYTGIEVAVVLYHTVNKLCRQRFIARRQPGGTPVKRLIRARLRTGAEIHQSEQGGASRVIVHRLPLLPL